jgi:hypothetical protein
VRADDTTRYVSTTGTDNPTCDASNPCRHIQYAVGIAQPGDTIRIAAGTYVEQVTVPKSLTFIGAGIDTTIIKGPDSKTFDDSGQTFIFELVGATTTDSVTQLTVSGPSGNGGGLDCAPNPLSLDNGVAVTEGATLNMKRAAVRDIFDVPDSGCQRGTAISVARPGTADVAHATLDQVQVTRYQKNGVAGRHAGSTLDLRHSTISNIPSSVIASNGIEVILGAKGTVQANHVSGNECNLAPSSGNVGCGPSIDQFQASGILVSEPDPSTAVAFNTVGSNDIGIYTDAGIPITDNNASANRFESIFIDTTSVGAIVRRNTANDGSFGIYVNGASGNTFEFDSAHRNSSFDMFTTSTANTFHRNSCDTAFPDRQTWDCTRPECSEGDGEGHFHGDKGDGDFQADGDGCADGDQNQLTSSNRGDGNDFQSSQITFVGVDPLTNTLIMSGLGTSNGVPVEFTMVAVGATLVTPASVTFVFSDGFTNAGNLLDGGITLQ